MNRFNSEHRFNSESHENELPTFESKFTELLPGVEFKESADMLEARTAVVETLTKSNLNPDVLQLIWTEYTDMCEQVVDTEPSGNPQIRAQLQIAMLVHKALIFHEAEDTQRYYQSLSDADEYAYNMHFDAIVEAISTELDNLES